MAGKCVNHVTFTWIHVKLRRNKVLTQDFRGGFASYLSFV